MDFASILLKKIFLKNTIPDIIWVRMDQFFVHMVNYVYAFVYVKLGF